MKNNFLNQQTYNETGCWLSPLLNAIELEILVRTVMHGKYIYFTF